MKKIVIVLLLAISGVLYAHIEMFEENESGFDLYCQWVPSVVDYGRSSRNVGFTVKGKYHIALSFKAYSDFATEWNGIALNFSRALLKQNDKNPFNVIIEESFEYGIYRVGDINPSFQSIEVSTGISHAIHLNKFKIIPIARFGWSYLKGNEYMRTRNLVNASFKCIVSFKGFFVFPEIKYHERQLDFMSGLGFVIPIKKNKRIHLAN